MATEAFTIRWEDRPPTLAEVERRWILATWNRCGRSGKDTAEALGIPLLILCAKLRAYEVEQARAGTAG